MDKTDDDIPAWRRDLRRANAALDSGDTGQARALLTRAQGLASDAPMELSLFDARLSAADGRLDRAEALLLAVAAAHPGNAWPCFTLARLLVEAGRQADARPHITAALARDPDARIAALQLLAVDVGLAVEDHQAAAASLSRLLSAHPDHPGLPRRLLALARPAAAAALARPLLERHLDRHPAERRLQLRLAQLLAEAPDAANAIARLQAIRARLGDHPAVMVVLAQACRRAGRTDEEDRALADGLAANAGDPVLLRHLFATQMTKARSETLFEVLDALAPHIDCALLDELHLQALLQTMQYDAAIDSIRRAGPRRSRAIDAQRLASALLGSGRYRLALRYLRASLRRWPRARGLISLYLIWGSKLGHRAEVRQALDRARPVLPDHLVTAQDLILCGMDNDLGGAIAAYETLRAGGHATKQHRDILAKLIFTRAPLKDIDAIHARIGNPAAESPEPLHRGGLPGMLTLELMLERMDIAAGDTLALEDWCRDRPQSTMAAIRLIDNRGATPASPPSESRRDDLPRRIFQYWNGPGLPETVAGMSETWSTATGYDHRLFNRMSARQFLREHYGHDWLQAFDLAKNPAEEADLLRLCLLVREGGIWADADDRLYGDLDALLAGTRGLVVYREALGGAIGNNFLAAPANHPALVLAAEMVRDALQERSADISWSKTGPGVLTRAIAQFLLATGDAAPESLSVLPEARVARTVAMHNPVRYKSLPDYWEKGGARARVSTLWPEFLARLQAARPTG